MDPYIMHYPFKNSSGFTVLIAAFFTVQLFSLQNTVYGQTRGSLFTDTRSATAHSQTPPGQIPRNLIPGNLIPVNLIPKEQTSKEKTPNEDKPLNQDIISQTMRRPEAPNNNQPAFMHNLNQLHLKVTPTGPKPKPLMRTYQHPQPHYPSFTKGQQLAPQHSAGQQQVLQRVLSQPSKQQAQPAYQASPAQTQVNPFRPILQKPIMPTPYKVCPSGQRTC